MSGEWPSDYKLPAEADLAMELSVARGTLRKAIKLLVKEGLMRQIHGKGTFVAGKEVSLSLVERLVTLHELFEIGDGSALHMELLAMNVDHGDQRTRSLLGVGESVKVLWLRRRLNLPGQARVLVENSIRLDLCPGLEKSDFANERLFDAIEKASKSRIEWGRRDFTAEKAKKEMAGFLGVKEGDPLLYLSQIAYLTGDRPVERSEIWVDGQTTRVTTFLKR